MDTRRIALLLLLFLIFSVDGKTTQKPTVTFRESGRTTPVPDNAGANKIMYRVVLPLCGVLLVAAVIAIICCYKYMIRRRRARIEAIELKEVVVEKPVVPKPVIQIRKNKITPSMDIIKHEIPIIKRLEAAKRKENIMMERSVLKQFSKLLKEKTQKKSKKGKRPT